MGNELDQHLRTHFIVDVYRVQFPLNGLPAEPELISGAIDHWLAQKGPENCHQMRLDGTTITEVIAGLQQMVQRKHPSLDSTPLSSPNS